MGWVRSFRNNQFIALNDGSTNSNIQIVAELGKFDEELLKLITTGSCIGVIGTLVQSQGQGQSVEIQAKEIEGHMLQRLNVLECCECKKEEKCR